MLDQGRAKGVTHIMQPDLPDAGFPERWKEVPMVEIVGVQDPPVLR
jgi:hypothetical protein